MRHGIVVLGTDHRLQGLPGNIADPNYICFIGYLISSYSVECVFEEAGGKQDSSAKLMADARQIKYCDVDIGQPHPGDGERERNYIVQPWQKFYSRELREIGVVEELLDAQINTEQFWLEKIRDHAFASGLLICGHLHTISIARRLQPDCEVTVLAYMPLCRLHNDSATKGQPDA
jgi:hypothetical protein